MSSVDDPMLALIMRFVSSNDEVRVSESEFLHLQAEAIRAYVGAFPKNERNERAVEWIAAHAEGYRQKWSNCIHRVSIESTRCSDCPLVSPFHEAPCEIHDRWLALLDAYVHHRITSKEYVHTSLALLRKHKTRLKMRRWASSRFSAAAPQKSCAGNEHRTPSRDSG